MQKIVRYVLIFVKFLDDKHSLRAAEGFRRITISVIYLLFE